MPARFAIAFIIALVLASSFTMECPTVSAQVSQNKEPGADVRADQAHAEWLAGILKQIAAIKPGVTRKDFEKTFVVDGGISDPAMRRYCYRQCPCIKVDVTFEAADGSKTPFTDPDARLTKVSKPYLETPYSD